MWFEVYNYYEWFMVILNLLIFINVLFIDVRDKFIGNKIWYIMFKLQNIMLFIFNVISKMCLVNIISIIENDDIKI